MEIYVRDLFMLGIYLALVFAILDVILYFDHNIGCKEIFMLNLFILFGKYPDGPKKHHASNNLNRT